jgi:GGDEF domain-containing protein
MTEDNGFLRDQINRYRESKRQIDEAQHRASSDHTTGLLNRHVGEGYLRLRLADSCLLTILSLDVTAAGEHTLQRAGQTVAEFNSTFEMICRWGSNRFVLITTSDVRPGDMVAQVKRRLKAADITEVRFAIARSELGDKVEDILAKLEGQLSRNSKPGA